MFEQSVLTAQVNSIRVAMIAACGSFNTSLATYFMNRDLFVSIVSFIDSPKSDVYVGDAFSLIGVLAAYGKLETHNPYRVRLADFVNHNSMIKTVRASGHVWQICLDQYQNEAAGKYLLSGTNAAPLAMVSSLAHWLGFNNDNPPSNPVPNSNSGLPVQQQQTVDESNKDINYPLEIMSLTVATYEAITANKVYAKILLECPATQKTPSTSSLSPSLSRTTSNSSATSSSSNSANGEAHNKTHKPSNSALENRSPPFATFISLCTYIFQNQHKTARAALYARLCLLVLRVVIESPILLAPTTASSAPSLLVDDTLRTKSIVVARQKTPYLPIVTFSTGSASNSVYDGVNSGASEPRRDTNRNDVEELEDQILNGTGNDRIGNKNSPESSGRLLMEGVLDALQCALRYNMKRSLDSDMYMLALTNLFQVIHFLRQAKFRLQYHWSELWKTLMSLVRFINSHPAPSVSSSNGNSVSSNDKANTSSSSNPQGHASYENIVGLIVLILSTSLIHGDTFLGNSSDYDDLFYKIMEGSEALAKLKSLFPSILVTAPSMTVLQAAINHYSALLSSNNTISASVPGAANKKQLNAQQVTEIIRSGYQTLSLHQYATTSGPSSSSLGNQTNGYGSRGSSSGTSRNSSSSNSSSLSGAGSNNSVLQSPSDIAAYLLYDPLPKLREPDERLFFKKLMRQVISDIQVLHSNIN